MDEIRAWYLSYELDDAEKRIGHLEQIIVDAEEQKADADNYISDLLGWQDRLEARLAQLRQENAKLRAENYWLRTNHTPYDFEINRMTWWNQQN